MPDHPSEEIEGVFGRPFTEQVAFFRNKLKNLVPTARWDDMQGDAHDTGFMVAGAAKADLLTDLAAAVDKAMAEGRGIEEFRRDFRSIVRRNGWTGWTGEGSVKGEAWRVGVIYRTNAYTSYAAGRIAQLREAKFPYWIYRHGGSKEPRIQHLGWDGLVLPSDHEFWDTHYPPSDWGCSCYVVGTHALELAALKGGDPAKKLPPDWKRRDPKTGAPIGIGKGWDYAPGASVASDVSALARKIEKWPALIGASFGASIRPQTDAAWTEWLARARLGKFNEPGFVGTLSADDIIALGDRGVAPASAEIYVRPGLVSGPKARRHATKGDALPDDVLENLPALIRKPRAILLDEKTGKLLYVLEGTNGLPQVAVELDYWLRSRGDRKQVNMVVSAYLVEDADITARLRGGGLSIIRGGLR